MIAEAWKDDLPESHRIALDIAYSDFFDAYFHLSLTEAEKIERVVASLPKRYISRYTALFCQRFIICMSSVAERLVQPQRITPVARCTAEAIALHTLVERATTILKEDKRIDADYGEFRSFAFRDTDFLSLYAADKDESEGGLDGRKPLLNNLEFVDWFKPYNLLEPVNPFVYEDWTTEQAGINFYR